MKYICKVFTSGFKKKFDECVELEANQKLDKKGVSSERRKFALEFESILIRKSFYLMWNKPELFAETPQVEEYYKSIGLWTPEFTIIELEAAEQGLQSRARVMWNNEVRKIDEIEEIFFYKSAA